MKLPRMRLRPGHSARASHQVQPATGEGRRRAGTHNEPAAGCASQSKPIEFLNQLYADLMSPQYAPSAIDHVTLKNEITKLKLDKDVKQELNSIEKKLQNIHEEIYGSKGVIRSINEAIVSHPDNIIELHKVIEKVLKRFKVVRSHYQTVNTQYLKIKSKLGEIRG